MNTKNFQTAHIGKIKDIGRYAHILPDSGIEMKGKLFINELVGLTGSEISFNSMPPKTVMPFYHKHTKNEEVYIILSGCGEFQIDDEVIAVEEGSIIRIAPDAIRTWRNISEESELIFITVQAKADSMDNSKPTSDGVALEKAVRW